MSADNWAECPICKGISAEKKTKLESKYGKVSREEYDKLAKELEEEEKDDEFNGHPLREDYELGVDDKGLAHVIYSAECQLCGASWNFRKDDIKRES